MHTTPSTTPSILLVDDDPHLLRLLTRFLRSSKPSYNLLAFSSGEAALAAFGGHSVQLAITDQRMPDMSGLHLAQLLKTRSPRTTIVLMSADAPSLSATSLPPSVDYYLAKPFRLDHLKQIVMTVLE
jgi:CheY-like chemotaxis protein